MTRARPITRQQTIKSIAIVAARKGITVRVDGKKIVVEDGVISRLFDTPGQAGAFLWMCGVL